MEYFGLEIFDGKPLKEISLEENISLEEQWFHLREDVTCIDYLIHNVLEFSIDVGWYPNIKIIPEARFQTIIIEGPYTDGAVFYEKEAKTIAEMKLHLKECISLMQVFKKMSIEEIIETKIRDFK